MLILVENLEFPRYLNYDLCFRLLILIKFERKETKMNFSWNIMIFYVCDGTQV
jgi:hypothetical protein